MSMEMAARRYLIDELRVLLIAFSSSKTCFAKDVYVGRVFNSSALSFISRFMSSKACAIPLRVNSDFVDGFI